jgi:hypothetical protein
MDTSAVGIATAFVQSRAEGTRQTLEIALLRRQAEADRSVVALLEAGIDAAKAPPPAPEGQGANVDRLA